MKITPQPSLEVFIKNTETGYDQTLTQFVTSAGVNIADLMWSAAFQQPCIVSQINNLHIKFDGSVFGSQGITMAASPNPGSYLSASGGGIVYFNNKPLTAGQWMNLNAAHLILNDCTLMQPEYRHGVTFDLRCDYTGEVIPEDGEFTGFIKILSSIDAIDVE